MLKHLLTTAALAAVSTAAFSAVPAHAAAPDAASARGKACNAHSYTTKVTNVTGSIGVKLTRLNGVVYPGRTKITKNTFVKSKTSSFATTSLHAEGGAELGGSGVLKKVVKIFGSAHGSVEYYDKSSNTKSDTKRIYSHTATTIPKASTVAWFKGYQTAKGKGKVSYCDAIEGSGEGFVKSYTAVWKTYATFSVEGAQRCDLGAPNPVAKAAKTAVCPPR
ncbi:hypothetical protein BH11ACT8_BH11ACT8_17650 [soil metagenome]